MRETSCVYPSELVVCIRCGIVRQIRTGRPNMGLCADCKTVEHHTAKAAGEPLDGYRAVRGPAGVVRFERVIEPMSDEDRAWCERQAERHFWASWERLNRRDQVTPSLMQKALDLSRDMSTTHVENLCASDQQLCTHPVDKTLHETGESVFDEGMDSTTEGVA